jgi:hypothetical protein
MADADMLQTTPIDLTLPDGFEIRPLELKHAELVRAPLCWNMVYQDHRLSHLYVGFQAKLCLENFQKDYNADRFADLCTTTLSIGIFDTQYKYERQPSREAGGALYWHELDATAPDFERDGRQKLAAAMDFSLVWIRTGHGSDPQSGCDTRPVAVRARSRHLADRVRGAMKLISI